MQDLVRKTEQITKPTFFELTSLPYQVAEYQQYQEATAEDEEPEGEYEEEGVPEE